MGRYYSNLDDAFAKAPRPRRLSGGIDGIIYSDDWQTQRICEKCHRLENIEERYGIELEDAFKALESGVFVKDGLHGIEYRTVRGIEMNGISVMSRVCSYPECDETYYFKEYGKTWSLVKEELENEERKD